MNYHIAISKKKTITIVDENGKVVARVGARYPDKATVQDFELAAIMSIAPKMNQVLRSIVAYIPVEKALQESSLGDDDFVGIHMTKRNCLAIHSLLKEFKKQ